MKTGLSSTLMITLANSWQYMGLCMIIYLAGLQNIPSMYKEAAKLDGASEWRVILQIMMPMSKPALASIILFSFVGQWNEYFWPLVMTNADMYPDASGG